jgi:hypothetical protein
MQQKAVIEKIAGVMVFYDAGTCMDQINCVSLQHLRLVSFDGRSSCPAAYKRWRRSRLSGSK